MASVSGVDTSTELQLGPSSMSKEELLCKTLSSIEFGILITDVLST